jgi:hypothetical protein
MATAGLRPLSVRFQVKMGVMNLDELRPERWLQVMCETDSQQIETRKIENPRSGENKNE